MKVYIIGAGPGDPKLLTLRAAELIEECPVVLYTGSLVPRAVLARARATAQVIDSSSLTLEEIVAVFIEARDKDVDVARVHTGDPTLFGSTGEQIRRLEELGIAYELIPGVSSFTAAACALGKELTLPELSQAVILTRVEGRTPMPKGQDLEALGRHGATLALFLSATLVREAASQLVGAYGASCPVAVVQRVSWPDQKIVWGTLADIADKMREAKIRSTAIILIGPALASRDFANSKLYDPSFTHRFRKASEHAG